MREGKPTEGKAKTSIKVDPEIWKAAKIAAIQKDIELSDLVERAIEEWIEKEAKKGGSTK